MLEKKQTFVRTHQVILFLGSRNESHTFLVNGEAYSRLHEAETHLYVYSGVRPLGEIDYVIVVCGATTHKKRWFLSSVYVACISECEDQGKVKSSSLFDNSLCFKIRNFFLRWFKKSFFH